MYWEAMKGVFGRGYLKGCLFVQVDDRREGGFELVLGYIEIN